MVGIWLVRHRNDNALSHFERANDVEWRHFAVGRWCPSVDHVNPTSALPTCPCLQGWQRGRLCGDDVVEKVYEEAIRSKIGFGYCLFLLEKRRTTTDDRFCGEAGREHQIRRQQRDNVFESVAEPNPAHAERVIHDITVHMVETDAPRYGARRTTSISPEAQAIFTVANSSFRSMSAMSAGTFGAWPSGQFGCGSRSSMT
jgi:hypothetical protein